MEAIIIELLGYVKAAGGLAAPIFAILYVMERGERIDAQTELKDVTKEAVATMVELKSMVGQLIMIFNSRKR